MIPNPLDWQRIAAETGAEVVWRSETGSTSDDARALAAQGAAHGTMILADSQTSGRGRRGAPWVSPPGLNLLCSVILRPQMPPEKWPRLTHACAFAVCELLESLPGLPAPHIKWPNDILLRGRKVCGILLESVLAQRGGFAIAGIGVNLNLPAAAIPDELRGIATSVLAENGGRAVCRTRCAIELHRRLMLQASRAASEFPDIRAGCDARSFLAGKRVRLSIHGTTREGTVTGSGPEGELLLLHDDGSEELIASADLVRPCGPAEAEFA